MLDNPLVQYEDLGKKWLSGKSFTSFGNIKFNSKQKEFLNAKERYCLFCGGFASGKTRAFLTKLYLMSVCFPNNRILLGRKTRQDIERVTLPDIFDVFPEGTYEHKLGPGKIIFPNGSEIIFFGLDALQSGAGQDVKKAEQAIKSLNLGAVFIDQLEEIEYRVFEALSGRLRKNVPLQQMNFTTNPANFWAYDYFKINPRPNTKLVMTSMLDNKENLSKEFIEDQMTKGELYVRRYVYGEWSPDTMVQGGVFPAEYIKAQNMMTRSAIRELDGIRIFEEPRAHQYQIGVDPSQGVVDPCGVKVVDCDTGELVASYKAFVPTSVIIGKTVQLAMMYSLLKKPLVIPEVNGAGLAFVEGLQKVYDNIYIRPVTADRLERLTQKLGFVTNHATKTQLIENMKNLLNKSWAKIRDAEVVEEMKTFIYTDEALQKGAGAQPGYHDDQLMATMLAYYGLTARTPREQTLLEELLKQAKTTNARQKQTSFE
jgi:PBSX family phage terminase large subunit